MLRVVSVPICYFILCAATTNVFNILLLLVTQIDNFENIYYEVECIENLKIFNNWFQVDVQPLKQSLLNIICKWSQMFKEHLVDHVTSRYVHRSEIRTYNRISLIKIFIPVSRMKIFI